MPRDYYEILGVQRNASADDIKKAFRKLAREFHPDVNKEPEAQQTFQEINEAYQVLSDDQKRAAYDRFGHAGVNNMGGAGGTYPGMEDIFGDLSEIFEMFTGSGRRSSSRRSGPRQGQDLRYNLNLTFEQAVHGADVPIEIMRNETCSVCDGNGAEPGTHPETCATCNGMGRVRQQVGSSVFGRIVSEVPCPTCGGRGQTITSPCHNCQGDGVESVRRTLEVNVPAGVDDGTRIRLSGEGEPGTMGGPRGNLYVFISVEPHEYFQRRDNDILIDIPINIAQAALGDEITVPTIHGDEKVVVKPGTQSGTVITLKGKGVPRLNRTGSAVGHGSQHVILNVEVPTKLSTKQRELFEELAETLGKDLKPQKAGKGLFERVTGLFTGE